MFKDKNKRIIFIIFLLFFVLVLFEHHYLWIYHDDYGYASLSYVSGFTRYESVGTNITLFDIIRFCLYHYKYWGGRILYFFFECTLFKLGFPILKFVQVIIITLIFFMLYKVIYQLCKKNEVLIALITCLSYGLIEAFVFRDGIFWVTASVLYLWPFLFFLSFIFFYNKKDKVTFKSKIHKFLYDCMLFIFMLLASFSQEQISSIMLGYFLFNIIYKYFKDKKFYVDDIKYLIPSLIGFFILLFCPGNKIRNSSFEFFSLSFIERFKIGFPNMMSSIYNNNVKIIMTLLLICAIYCTKELLKNTKNVKYKRFLKIVLVSTCILIISNLYMTSSYEVLKLISNLLTKKNHTIIISFILLIQTILWSIPIFDTLIKNNKIHLAFLFLLGFGSQVMLITFRYFPYRSMLIFYIISFIVMIYLFIDIIKINIKIRKIIVFSIAIISIINFSYITYGYYSNYKVSIENDKILKETSKKLNSSEIVEKVILKKYKNNVFSNEMPYQEEYDYIYDWIRSYYNLPDWIIIEYE